ncbi:glycoside hydrolase family 172 protein [Atribacter laminatus]|uniref:DUF2961 domain-containing protein n=1 Tax=Atribacter laminatus TaxID=2847778 RepID=A0A7T1F2V5_ATRLM|nr:glycoside hydrolase family 172 protein [Atribacter laminatus]QPM68147.1 hypothetical protein RT761_01361 [Atribacter laminatus]
MNNITHFNYSLYDELTRAKSFTSKRISSWDRSGKNYDWLHVLPGEKAVLAEIEGPGCIRHIYALILSFDLFFYRNLILRMYWDGETSPSVEVPIGDFFGIGLCKPRLFSSLMLTVNQGDPLWATQGLNSYFPMPFSKSARIEIENLSNIPLESFWYHIDYQLYEEIDDNVMRFHAQWWRESPTLAQDQLTKNIVLWDGINEKGKGNYMVMEAEGDGQLVGIFLEVDNIVGDWWGEGDDMVFIDGETWPPSFHGTGTEEIFGGGASPTQEYAGPYTGFPLISSPNYYRQSAMYRFFITDPIRFKKSIKYTIEHGHANNYENDYSSVGYWYQFEPHKQLIASINTRDRIPVLTDGQKQVFQKQTQVALDLYKKIKKLQGDAKGPSQSDLRVTREQISLFRSRALKAYHEGIYDLALKEWEMAEKFIKSL